MPVMNGKRRGSAYLEDVRNRYGDEALKNVYHDAAERDAARADQWLNDPAVRFPTLFVLRPEILKAGAYARLNGRNRGALELSGSILSGRLAAETQERGDERESLLWMLETGQGERGLGEDYDEVMDTAALLLARAYRHRGCIRSIERLLFDRHREGGCTHDLIWAFFEASEPRDLLLLANRLRSADVKDAELARQLLNFVPCLEREAGLEGQYRCARKWLLKNLDRLQYTGETNQQRSNPRRYAIPGEARPEETEDEND